MEVAAISVIFGACDASPRPFHFPRVIPTRLTGFIALIAARYFGVKKSATLKGELQTQTRRESEKEDLFVRIYNYDELAIDMRINCYNCRC